ncbi:MAG: preprotein translocase subunit YajC [Bacillota bacterium]|uniref:Preprotein translocase subunit YajC n=1 Tax=Virgibacillus salarius TaxID=447199 RepID=A0A941DW70_9BACI|nr:MULTISPECIES: preprotein translocase subunit YajC [Bacillaceae]NAZ10555.1 preprotein translocase subunit YajC [Agaribacter marinus]MBR7797845.1 preprotein translocase subunit YajC [Virgibacillus salarius]MCC2251147.1 preprotein translocase subunit YajC [Virgibacillus sp. AGTR]MDY7045274.1 preprotein translocase subunit YajC [Virgibacillus sp. M23]QRZ17542.1 preprotein translocase subunit YajC [Virgibacillus sp. AGTR]
MEMLVSLLPIILMFVIFYFLLIRPQQKRQKQVRQMQSDLQKGDTVITIGGFHGEIHAMDENTVVIQGGDGSKLTYDRSAIREVKQ